jgi:thiamine-phosphate pyrophosphorylase
MVALPRLYAIADAAFGNPVHIVRELFEGGARLVQVRNKKAGAGELLDQVEAILRFAPDDARIIVNDRVDVAILSKAHGVHLGQDDLPIAQARSILRNPAWIGYSTHNLEQAVEADGFDVDYIAVGPVFMTTSKENPDPVMGLAGLAKVCAAVHRPVVAIGGITLDRAADVFATGASSVAVIGDLLRYDVTERTRAWIHATSCPV